MKIKGKLNSVNDVYHKQGVKVTNQLLQPFKLQGNLDKIDIYLLQGIYDEQPEEIVVSEDERTVL